MKRTIKDIRDGWPRSQALGAFMSLLVFFIYGTFDFPLETLLDPPYIRLFFSSIAAAALFVNAVFFILGFFVWIADSINRNRQ